MKHTTFKMSLTLVLTLIFITVFMVILMGQNIYYSSQKNSQQEEMKLDSFMKSYDELERVFVKAVKDTETLYATNAVLSATALEHVIADMGDKAIMIYGQGGAVIKVENGKITAPNHLETRLGLYPENFEKTKGSITVLTQEKTISQVSFCRIGSSDYYFVSWEDNVNIADQVAQKLHLTEVLDSAEAAYDGHILILAPDPLTKEYEFYYEPELFSEVENFADLQMDLDTMRNSQISFFTYNGVSYQCAVRDSSERDTIAIFMMPMENMVLKSLRQSIFMFVIMAILLFSFVVGCYSLYDYVGGHKLPPVLEKRYQPSRVRRFVVMYGILGTIAIAASGALVYSLNELLDTTEDSKETLAILNDRLTSLASESEFNATGAADNYEDYAEHISCLMDVFPELRTQDTLREISRRINADSITLYDRNGEELLSSEGYIGLKLSTNSTSYDYDFRRLLNGVRIVRHDPAFDKFTGTEQVKIGARINDLTEDGTYGAMIMSISPDLISSNTVTEPNAVMEYMSTEDTFFFTADREKGIITHSNYEELIDLPVTVMGLSESNLRGEMMNFVQSPYGRYFVVSTDTGEDILYYARQNSRITTGMTAYLLTSCILYIITYAALAFISLHSYTNSFFETYRVKGDAVETGENEVVTPSGQVKMSVDPSKRWSSLRGMWTNLLPEQKALAVAQVIALVSILFSIDQPASETGFVSANRLSLYYYLMAGDWDRGFNTFAAASILLLGAEILLGVIIIRYILRVLTILLGTKGETICRLLNNLIEYAAVLGFLYLSLSYLGIDTRALLASVSLLTLAISLGAKDLVADILAGITIVFEGEFQVGDIVEIGGYRGTVIEIGVRSTKILGQGGNIKIIGNQDVKGVINMTQLNSWYPVEITVPSDVSVDEMEKWLKEELPKIGESHPDIILSGPTYKGVTKIGTGTLTITIITECKEENYRRVQRVVNKSVQRLFAKHGIKI